MKGSCFGVFVAWALLAIPIAETGQAASMPTNLVLKGGMVVDGTGTPAHRANVAVRGDRIVAVGSFEVDPAAKVVDATGMIVAPGFIDLHTHSDAGIVRPETRLNLNYLRQGVTTIVTGNCGGGAIDITRYFGEIDTHGAGTNVIHLIPHGNVREEVIGQADRRPSSDELARMRAIVDREMKGGAWGMSTGLIYVPSLYARTDEIIELAKVVRRYGGLYASHIRDEAGGLLESVDEAIAVGDGAGVPVHISHLKVTGRKNWGTVRKAITKIAEARAAGKRISADQYPYIASSTSLAAMVVPPWAAKVDGTTFDRLTADPARGPELRRFILHELADRDDGAAVRIARYEAKPEWAGLDLAAIARKLGTSPLDVVLEVQRHGGAQAIGFVMGEDDVREVMRHPFVATASDGSTHLPGRGDRPHPRSYGTFPRKIRYALDEKVLSIEEAVRSSTGWPAEILGLTDRGVVRMGAVADLVVFDPRTFRDSATFEDPTQFAPGVRYLLVNGVAMIADGRMVEPPRSGGKLPGRALRLGRDGQVHSADSGQTSDRPSP